MAYVSPGYGTTPEKIRLLLETPTTGSADSLTVGTVPACLSPNGASIPIRSVTVKADDDNTGSVYIGFSSSVTTTDGFRLKAGQGIDIAIDDLNKVWVVADADGQKIYILWVK